MRRKIFQLSLIAAIIWACGDDQGPPALGPNAVTQSVGSGGGTLVSKDGTVRLEVPPGAISENRTITLDELSPAALGPAFAGMDVDASFDMGPGGTTFDKPVTVTIRSAQRATVTDSTASVRGQMLFTVENGAAVPLDNATISVVGDSVSVSGQTTHFSPLVLISTSAEVEAKILDIPESAEVGRPFSTVLLVTATGDAPPTLIAASYNDESLRVSPTIPSARILAQDNHIEGIIRYTCTSEGLAFVKPIVVLEMKGNQFSGAGPVDMAVGFSTWARGMNCAPRTAVLGIEFRGDGRGRVNAGPAPAFTCDGSCTQRLLEELDVHLTAVPDEDSQFAGFSGDCRGSTDPDVAEPLSMAGDPLCIVTFIQKPTHTVSVMLAGLGSGTVKVNGVDCADDCAVQVPAGAPVELRATPNAGSRFAFWGPNCPTPTPNEPIIVFTPNGPVSCEAIFPLEQLNITIAPAEAVLDIGEVQRLNVVITDETGTVDREVTFTSGIPSVASVDAEGNVTGLAPGTAAIAASVAGPGGGVAYSFITVNQTLFGLTVKKAGSGTGTTSIYNTGNGESTNFCDLDCPGLTARFAQNSILHVFASPGAGSTFVQFLDDCAPDPVRPEVGIVNLTGAKTCTVEFGTSGPLSIAFGGLTSKSTGLPVSLSSVSGVVYADYETENLPSGWDSMNVRTSIDGVPTGACLPPSLGGRIRCELNTLVADSLVTGILGLKVRNGPRTLKLDVTTPDGSPVATVEQPLTLANPNQITITTNNPPGTGSSNWRAGRIDVRVGLTIADDIPTDGLDVLLNAGPPPSNSGPLLFNPGPPNDPWVFTADPASSPDAQGFFEATPIILDGGGNDITSIFNPPPGPWQQNIDMVPPDVPSIFVPPSTPISGGVLFLDFQTGPYSAGTSIPLSRIIGGTVVGAHAPFCAATHYHGSISIQRENSLIVDGPFADPRNGADCGHGQIGTETFHTTQVSFSGSATDLTTVTTTVRTYKGENGCDVTDIIDDIPFPTGTGPGQMPNPFFQTTENPFLAEFDFILDPSMAGQDVCFRIQLEDSAVGPDGQPANVVRRVLETTFEPFILPPSH